MYRGMLLREWLVDILGEEPLIVCRGDPVTGILGKYRICRLAACFVTNWTALFWFSSQTAGKAAALQLKHWDLLFY